MNEIGSEIKGEDIYFTTNDGVKLNGYYVDHGSEKTILYFHGNAGNISLLEERRVAAQDLGYNIFLFDYRGYGKSEGSIAKESDIYADGEAAYGYVLGRMNGDSKKILFWGKSLGGAIAIHTAQNQELAGLIVESSFLSMEAMARYEYPYIPIRFLLRFHFRSDQALQNVKAKTLIFHSKTDETIPFWNSEGLFAAAKNPKRFVATQGSHNEGFLDSREQILTEIAQYFPKNGLPKLETP